ncbi:hypothetical protein [Tautonia plasticadhaerens]|uniref:Uncharacterized protein n=1 Tax=Tautonia plasticadhaerens TaxID=2527974 RepID=A0A518HE72_9BACT|nr:hypothetical protein [Tautonia plasticadhaerens]QDV39150.1 hypothetical protein ElP_71140 [Tautonia plasticadhaerens]
MPLEAPEASTVDVILDLTGQARRRVAGLVEAARCLVLGWVERNIVAEFPADEDLP